MQVTPKLRLLHLFSTESQWSHPPRPETIQHPRVLQSIRLALNRRGVRGKESSAEAKTESWGAAGCCGEEQ